MEIAFPNFDSIDNNVIVVVNKAQVEFVNDIQYEKVGQSVSDIIIHPI